MVILVLFYLSAIFAPFLSPNDPQQYFDAYVYARRSSPASGTARFLLRPFYYVVEKKRDPVTLQTKYVVNTDKRLYVLFFTKGFEYKLLGSSIPIFICSQDRKSPPVCFWHRWRRPRFVLPQYLCHPHFLNRGPGRRGHHVYPGMPARRHLRLLRRAGRHGHPACD